MGRKKRQEREGIAEEKSRRPLLGCGLAALLGAVTVFAVQESKTKPAVDLYGKRADALMVSIHQARANPSLREGYVDAVKSLIGEKPYVRSIAYRPGIACPADLGNAGMSTDVSLDSVGSRTPYAVTIYDEAFTNRAIETDQDFLSVLVDHEIEGHAKPLYEGVPLLEKSFFHQKGTNPPKYWVSLQVAVWELFAFRNQLNQGRSRGVSAEMMQNNFASYIRNYANLAHPAWDDREVDPEKLRKLRIEFFPQGAKGSRVTVDGVPRLVFSPDGMMTTVDGTIPLPSYVTELIRK